MRDTDLPKVGAPIEDSDTRLCDQLIQALPYRHRGWSRPQSKRNSLCELIASATPHRLSTSPLTVEETIIAVSSGTRRRAPHDVSRTRRIRGRACCARECWTRIAEHLSSSELGRDESLRDRSGTAISRNLSNARVLPAVKASARFNVRSTTFATPMRLWLLVARGPKASWNEGTAQIPTTQSISTRCRT